MLNAQRQMFVLGRARIGYACLAMGDAATVPIWLFLIGLFSAPWVLTRFQRSRGWTGSEYLFMKPLAARVGLVSAVVLVVVGSAYYTISVS